MEFHNKLVTWYLQNKRNLPWRVNRIPYHVWLSEIILQQTRVDQGLPYFLSFIDAFPTVFDLADAKEEQVLKLWQGLGYYSRARNLHSTAKVISANYNGVFPNTYIELIKLKGIGDYTASAISSICFNESKAVVDGNVFRVLARYFNMDTPINSTKGIKEFKQLAQELLPSKNIGDYNQAIMELGAVVCKPQNPSCSICPLNQSCLALKNDTQKDLPVKLANNKPKTIYFNYLVVLTENKSTVIEKRLGKGIWQNLYQFPLIESAHPLTEHDLKKHPTFKKLVNDSKVELSLFNSFPIVHKLSHRTIFTNFWIVNLEQAANVNYKWDELYQLPVPVLIANFLKQFKIG